MKRPALHIPKAAFVSCIGWNGIRVAGFREFPVRKGGGVVRERSVIVFAVSAQTEQWKADPSSVGAIDALKKHTRRSRSKPLFPGARTAVGCSDFWKILSEVRVASMKKYTVTGNSFRGALE
ncbi:MAG: hypothetical protein ACREF8_01370, partial [Chthoniobacterales bacterium]